jgi:hypothetical protein
MAQLRVGNGTHQTLKQLAQRTGESMQAVLDKALEEYRRKQFFQELGGAFAAMQSVPSNWESELAEREAWADTLKDNLDDETWTEEGGVATRG